MIVTSVDDWGVASAHPVINSPQAMSTAVRKTRRAGPRTLTTLLIYPNQTFQTPTGHLWVNLTSP